MEGLVWGQNQFLGGPDGRPASDQRSRPGRGWGGDRTRLGPVGRWTRDRGLIGRNAWVWLREHRPLRQDADAGTGGRAHPPLLLRDVAPAAAWRGASGGRGALLRARELGQESGR